MDIKYSSCVLFVKDIEVSRQFYSTILNQEIDLDFGKNIIFKAGFAIWEIRPGHIIPATLGQSRMNSSLSNRFELYFETEDLENIYKQLQSKLVRFLHDIHEEPWGQRTIRFFDPDHHLIEIGESMYRFIRRFHDQGLSVEQIREKTGVPVEEIRRLLVHH